MGGGTERLSDIRLKTTAKLSGPISYRERWIIILSALLEFNEMLDNP